MESSQAEINSDNKTNFVNFIFHITNFDCQYVNIRRILQSHYVCYYKHMRFPELTIPSYGESHCRSVGCIVDGVPPGMELTEDDIQPQMTRRRPGQSALTTPRDEKGTL